MNDTFELETLVRLPQPVSLLRLSKASHTLHKRLGKACPGGGAANQRSRALDCSNGGPPPTFPRTPPQLTPLTHPQRTPYAHLTGPQQRHEQDSIRSNERMAAAAAAAAAQEEDEEGEDYDEEDEDEEGEDDASIDYAYDDDDGGEQLEFQAMTAMGGSQPGTGQPQGQTRRDAPVRGCSVDEESVGHRVVVGRERCERACHHVERVYRSSLG